MLFLLLSTTAIAKKEMLPSSEIMKLCKGPSVEAREIMMARQNGAQLSNVLESLQKTYMSGKYNNLNHIYFNIYKSMAIDAWGHPYYLTNQMKKYEIENFENKEYLACYKSFEK